MKKNYDYQEHVEVPSSRRKNNKTSSLNLNYEHILLKG